MKPPSLWYVLWQPWKNNVTAQTDFSMYIFSSLGVFDISVFETHRFYLALNSLDTTSTITFHFEYFSPLHFSLYHICLASILLLSALVYQSYECCPCSQFLLCKPIICNWGQSNNYEMQICLYHHLALKIWPHNIL